MLKEQIMKDLIQAMKEKDKVKKGVLQLLKAGLEKAEKEKKEELTPAEEIQVVQREVKQTKDSLAEAEKYGRDDLVNEAKEKLAVLTGYLPQQLSEEEVRAKLAALGVCSGMNMGEAMKLAMKELSGKAENSVISKVVKSIISN